jgi:hypothetical protein
MSPSAHKRLLHDLTAVAALVDGDRPSADERLVASVGQEGVQALRSAVAGETRPGILDGAVAKFASLKQWQWSVLLASLACGVAVSMMGVIQLISQLRPVLSVLVAVAVVLSVFLKTRHHRLPDTWIGS